MLGARIAALRREAGMSQTELAKKLSVSTSAIGMYEQGRREPSGDRLVAMAQLFGVSTDYLLTGSPTCPSDRAVLERIFRRIESKTCTQWQLRDSEGQLRSFSTQEVAMLFSCLLMEA